MNEKMKEILKQKHAKIEEERRSGHEERFVEAEN